MSYTVSMASHKPSKPLSSKPKLPVIKAQSAVFNTQTGIEKVSTIGGILVDKNQFKYGLGTCHGLKQKFVDSQNEFLGDRDQEIINKKGDVFFTRTSETVEEIGISAVMLEDSVDTVFSGFVLRGRTIDNKLDVLFKKYCF